MMQQQQQLQLKQDMSISQILRFYGKHFTQVRKRYSDGQYGKCAIGVIMSYLGWNGRDERGSAKKLLAVSVELKRKGVDEGLLIDLNDSGYTFDEIADYLDGVR